ncbi:hypothetical protein HK104_004718 [Borealophlyctis nickersoniae]|nr:hypothetical protein HK104_004718 [Borealophlyctis nickersoniae]
MKVSILALFLIAKQVAAIGRPLGFAGGSRPVTGGGNRPPVIPRDTNELRKLLADNTPRVILLDKTYDFTNSEGRVTEQGCRPWSCSANPQLAINAANNWCGNHPKATVTYNKASTSGLTVGSHKTILGKGSKGVIRGKGLRMANGVTNIIVQNIKIIDLNPHYVWGGDAITIAGADGVWIDHNEIQNIGRQMIVTGYASATRVTISHNIFNGITKYSPSCNNAHYWTLLFLGDNDSITVANNFIHDTSGRGPKIGGHGSQTIHMVNNYWLNTKGHALDAEVGGKALLEGNYFANVQTPMVMAGKGAVYITTSATHGKSCQSYLGRKCVRNVAKSSGSIARADLGALPYFTSNNVKATKAYPASQVPSRVVKNAGVGKIN